MPACAMSRTKRLGFERGDIGDEQAVGAGFGRVAHESGARDDDIRVGQDTEGTSGCRARKPAIRSKQSPTRTPASERALRRRLDHRPVGDGIGEGDADLDHVGARRDDRVEQARAGLEVGIAEHQERAERAFARRAARTWRRSGSCEQRLRLGDILVAAPERPTMIDAIRLLPRRASAHVRAHGRIRTRK